MAETLLGRVTVRNGPGSGNTWRASENIPYPPPAGHTQLRFEIEDFEPEVRDKIRFSMRRDDVASTDNNIRGNLSHGVTMPVYTLPESARGLFIAGVHDAPKPFTLLIYSS